MEHAATLARTARRTTRSWAAALLALPLLGGLAASQDDPPLPPDLGLPPTELLASDGQPIAPGRVPAGTSEVALARWQRMLGAIGEAASLPPVTSFDLNMKVTQRRKGVGSNDTQAGFRYLEDPRGPFLRAYLERKDLVILRGPQGDFLIDDQTTKPLAGREGALDRRRLDEYTSICRNFLCLTRPDQVRLVRLEAREVAPALEGDARTDLRFVGAEEPVRLSAKDDPAAARALEWVYVESPDFRLVEPLAQGVDAGVPRALLGLDAKTGEVRLAVLAEAGKGALVEPASMSVALGPYVELAGGWRIPRSLLVRPVDLDVLPLRFSRLENTDLWLYDDCRLNPDFTPRDFVPPR